MSLTQEQKIRLGKLTSLSPRAELDISIVVDSFASLSKTDTTHIDTVSRSGQGSLMPRVDMVVDSGLADDLLACSNQRKAAHQIMLGGIMVGE